MDLTKLLEEDDAPNHVPAGAVDELVASLSRDLGQATATTFQGAASYRMSVPAANGVPVMSGGLPPAIGQPAIGQPSQQYAHLGVPASTVPGMTPPGAVAVSQGLPVNHPQMHAVAPQITSHPHWQKLNPQDQQRLRMQMMQRQQQQQQQQQQQRPGSQPVSMNSSSQAHLSRLHQGHPASMAPSQPLSRTGSGGGLPTGQIPRSTSGAPVHSWGQGGGAPAPGVLVRPPGATSKANAVTVQKLMPLLEARVSPAVYKEATVIAESWMKKIITREEFVAKMKATIGEQLLGNLITMLKAQPGGSAQPNQRASPVGQEGAPGREIPQKQPEGQIPHGRPQGPLRGDGASGPAQDSQAIPNSHGGESLAKLQAAVLANAPPAMSLPALQPVKMEAHTSTGGQPGTTDLSTSGSNPAHHTSLPQHVPSGQVQIPRPQVGAAVALEGALGAPQQHLQEKPMTKYAKQKLRKAQEEVARKAEEERRRREQQWSGSAATLGGTPTELDQVKAQNARNGFPTSADGWLPGDASRSATPPVPLTGQQSQMPGDSGLPGGLFHAPLASQPGMGNLAFSSQPQLQGGVLPVNPEGMHVPAGRSASHKHMADEPPTGAPPPKKAKLGPSDGGAAESIDRLNDVTAVSGVDLREEEENLLALPLGGSSKGRAQGQGGEERSFLEITSLRARVTATAQKCGVRAVGESSLSCLSIAVEERLRTLLMKLTKLSAQRVDISKGARRVVTTSNVLQQLRLIERREREEQERRQVAEQERLRRLGEKERKDKGPLGEAEREAMRAAAQEAKELEEKKQRAKSANEAAKVAVGMDPRHAQWLRNIQMKKLAAERQGGAKPAGDDLKKAPATGVAADNEAQDGQEAPSGTGPGRPGGSAKVAETSASLARAPSAKAGSAVGGAKAHGMGRRPGQGAVGRRGSRSIGIRDVIALLEREPQMSKSPLLYRLYEQQRKEGGEGTPGIVRSPFTRG